MKMRKRGQISTEYMMVVSFLTFIILATLGIAFYYSAQMKDTIKFNQLESFSQKIITISESIFYSGDPSRTTTTAYLPEGVNNISFVNPDLIFNVSTSSGENIIAYKSNVNLTVDISTSSGMKKLYLNATETHVIVHS